jgi:HPt (histidine-containing phosphotransfer) domain-containing protein
MATDSAPPPDDLLDGIAGIDLTDVLDRLSGNRAHLVRLLRKFRDMWQSLPGTLRAGVNSGDLTAVRRGAHSLRGSAAMLALERVAMDAKALEKAAENGDLVETTRCLDCLEVTLTPLWSAIARLSDDRPHLSSGS